MHQYVLSDTPSPPLEKKRFHKEGKMPTYRQHVRTTLLR